MASSVALAHRIVRYIRGVGSAEPNSGLDVAIATLRSSGVEATDIAEINWSWQKSTPLPYESQSPVVDLNYLRRLGAAVRTAAMSDIEIRTDSFIRRRCGHILCSCLWLLQLTPCFLLLCPIFLALALPRVAYAILMLPIIAYPGALIFSLASGHPFRIVARAASLLFLWPAVFVAVVPATAHVFFSIGGGGILVWLWGLTWPERADWFLWSSTGSDGIPHYDNFLQTLVGALIGFPALLVPYGMFILITIMYGYIRSIFTPILKVLGDILLYLGSPAYRLTLLASVYDDLIRAGRGGESQFVILSHSLGSIICIDLLRSLWKHDDGSVTLVTAGSPLRRFFQRYFPERYPKSATLTEDLSTRVPEFTWLNIFRPNDPIGTSLGLAGGADISTKQKSMRCTNAHFKYWVDPEVYRYLFEKLATIPTLAATTVVQGRASTRAEAQAQVKTPLGLWPHYCTVLVAGSILCKAAWFVFVVPIFDADANLRALRSSGERTVGTLYVYTEQVRGGDHGVINVSLPRYTVSFTPPASTTPITGMPSSYLCETTSLRRLFDENAKTVSPLPHSNRNAVAIKVDVKFIADNPAIFTIEHCERSALPWYCWPLAFATFAFSLPSVMAFTGALGLLMRPLTAAFIGLTDEELEKTGGAVLRLIDKTFVPFAFVIVLSFLFFLSIVFPMWLMLPL